MLSAPDSQGQAQGLRSHLPDGQWPRSSTLTFNHSWKTPISVYNSVPQTEISILRVRLVQDCWLNTRIVDQSQTICSDFQYFTICIQSALEHDFKKKRQHMKHCLLSQSLQANPKPLGNWSSGPHFKPCGQLEWVSQTLAQKDPIKHFKQNTFFLVALWNTVFKWVGP